MWYAVSSRLAKVPAVVCLVAVLAATAAVAAVAAAQLPGLPDLPALDIPNTRFELPNGLTVVVHEDHKAPIVAVNIWYHVGSKNEPPGRTGFAHLFEHLMFGGKSGTQKGWFERMEALGATTMNGTTSFDRTNFFETVPSAALDTTLFLESQRMGHLLDEFSEQVLTTQRGVVQNEKRQGDNQPYHVAEDVITQSVWPGAHPYSHSVIGEMADLDAASIANVKEWFAKYYGPTNAVIVLAGDISSDEARAKVAKYFGDLPPGPPLARQKVWRAARTGEQRAAVQDRVPLARFYKVWNVPEVGTADADYLQLLSDVLDNGKTSRLYSRLVYQDQVAAAVNAQVDLREIGSLFRIEITAKAGVDLTVIEKSFNEELARLLRDGPTAAEVDRVKTARLAGWVRGIERVGGFGGKSDVLAAAVTYDGSADAWQRTITHWRAATPGELVGAGRRWLADGALVINLTPYPTFNASDTGLDRKILPLPGAMQAPSLPPFLRATLSNGLRILCVERHSTPTVELRLVLDAGRASDPAARTGVAALAATLLNDGTQSMASLEFSDRLMQQGATFGVGLDLDATYVSMSALSSRLDAALDLYFDALLHPGFRETEVAREKALAQSALAQTKQSPAAAAMRIALPMVYGSQHAYGALTTAATIAALTREDVRTYHQSWFVPNGATLIVVGDTDLASILPKLEARVAGWKRGQLPQKTLDVQAASSAPVLYLLDKPGAVQSVITANLMAPPRRNDDDLAIQAMNTVLGGAFTSRLNMNLREDKHWSYGAQSYLSAARGPSLYTARAAVQTDKTGDSLAEMKRELSAIVTTHPVTEEELRLAQGNLTLTLPGRWETASAVASTLGEMTVYGLDDDYYAQYVPRVQSLTVADASRGAARVIKPNALVWVVVGDRTKIEPDLRSRGIEVRIVDADGKPEH